MKTITVIGKNSRLYSCLDFSEKMELINIIELSFKDVENELVIENPVIFSYSRNKIENLNFLSKVASKSTGKIILISSTAVDVCSYIKLYSYPNIKFESESFVSALPNSVIIRVGITTKSQNTLNGFHGRVRVTTYDDLVKSIIEVIINENHMKLVDTTNSLYLRGSKYYQFFHFFQHFIFSHSKFLFFIFRPSLFLFKIFKYKNYGYTFISNQL